MQSARVKRSISSMLASQNPDLFKSFMSFIKLEYQGEIRKIEKVQKFRQLIRLAQSKFDELQAMDASMLKFSYDDSDAMQITISNDEDLLEALEQIEEGKFLKVFVKTTQQYEDFQVNEETDQLPTSNILEDSDQSSFKGSRTNTVKSQQPAEVISLKNYNSKPGEDTLNKQDQETTTESRHHQRGDRGADKSEKQPLQIDQAQLKSIIQDEIKQYASQTLRSIIENKINNILSQRTVLEEKERQVVTEVRDFDVVTQPFIGYVVASKTVSVKWRLRNKGEKTWLQHSLRIKTAPNQQLVVLDSGNEEVEPDQIGTLNIKVQAPPKNCYVKAELTVYIEGSDDWVFPTNLKLEFEVREIEGDPNEEELQLLSQLRILESIDDSIKLHFLREMKGDVNQVAEFFLNQT